ncbi:MAG: addiction module protein [Sulfurimonas sp.]|nr:addiction module protein [Sulfurimonas sp.]MDD3834526.1 addiction module protein [Sulfurimonas sp.]
MIQLSIQEPKIEKFFNGSKDEIMKALKFIVDNNIHDFSQINSTSELSEEQKKELASRINSFHENRSIGRDWNDIKSDLER